MNAWEWVGLAPEGNEVEPVAPPRATHADGSDDHAEANENWYPRRNRPEMHEGKKSDNGANDDATADARHEVMRAIDRPIELIL